MARPRLRALHLIPILALVFGACSQGASPAASPGSAAPATPAASMAASVAPTAAAAPVTVKVWALPWTEDDMKTIWEPLIARFEAENPDIKLEVELIPAADRR